jgi:hypothetical protein
MHRPLESIARTTPTTPAMGRLLGPVERSVWLSLRFVASLMGRWRPASLTSAFEHRKHLSSAIQVCWGHEHCYRVRVNTKPVVGRGGLEPPTSAVDRPERCAKGCVRSRISRAQCAELCGAASTPSRSRNGPTSASPARRRSFGNRSFPLLIGERASTPYRYGPCVSVRW